MNIQFKILFSWYIYILLNLKADLILIQTGMVFLSAQDELKYLLTSINVKLISSESLKF